METVKNAVNSASTALFGNGSNSQQNETAAAEPVSGQTGAGTVDEPYDKGNQEATDPTSTSTSSTTTDSKPTMSSAPSDTTTGDPSSGQQPFQKQQGGDRPTEEPSNPASTQAVQTSKNEAEATQSSDQTASQSESSAAKAMTGDGKHPHDEDERQEMAQKGELPKIAGDHSGEPMKMHGATDQGADKEGEGSAKTDRSKSVAQEGGGEHGKEKGTGEQWVKTKGMAADGGDFDATKPGAGKEATRLLEQKGIHKDKPADAPAPAAGGGNKANKGDKPSTMGKLKDKLHIGTGKHGSDKSV